MLKAKTDYLAFGVGVAVGAASFFMLLLSIFLTSGDAAGLTVEPVGDGTGDETGLAAATGAGVVGGLFGVGSAEHAPRTATDAAKTVDNITDLLIVFLLEMALTFGPLTHERAVRGRLRCSRNDSECLSAKHDHQPHPAIQNQHCAR